MKSLRMLGFAAVLLAAALACSRGAPKPTPTPTGTLTVTATPVTPGPSRTPAPNDTATAPSVTEVLSTPPSASLCDNQYFPVVMNATWKFNTSAAAQYEDSQTLTNLSADGFEISHQVSPPPGDQAIWTEPWNCTDQGLVRNPSNTDLAMLAIGPGGPLTITTLSVDGVTLPKTLQQGDSWQQRMTFELASSDNQTEQYTLTYSFSAGATEQVSVPAGEFDALRLDIHASWAPMSDSTMTSEVELTEWYAPDVGLVKWTTPSGGTSELASYTIP
jgi:uncharacterized protein DUF3108